MVKINVEKITQSVNMYVCEICGNKSSNVYKIDNCEKICKQKACKHTDVEYDIGEYFEGQYEITLKCKICKKHINTGIMSTEDAEILEAVKEIYLNRQD